MRFTICTIYLTLSIAYDTLWSDDITFDKHEEVFFMNMGASYGLGLLVGLLVAAWLVRAFAKKLHKNGEKKEQEAH